MILNIVCSLSVSKLKKLIFHPLMQTNQVTYKILIEYWLSFIGVLFYSVVFALMILTGMLLMPLIIITVAIRAIIEIYRWKRMEKEWRKAT